MNVSSDLRKMLVDSTLGYQRTMPIFRLKELSEQEVEARAVTFAEDFFGLYDDSQFRYNRRPNEGATDLVFHDDTLVRGFHASGALVAREHDRQVRVLVRRVGDGAQQQRIGRVGGLDDVQARADRGRLGVPLRWNRHARHDTRGPTARHPGRPATPWKPTADAVFRCRGSPPPARSRSLGWNP